MFRSVVTALILTFASGLVLAEAALLEDQGREACAAPIKNGPIVAGVEHLPFATVADELNRIFGSAELADGLKTLSNQPGSTAQIAFVVGGRRGSQVLWSPVIKAKGAEFKPNEMHQAYMGLMSRAEVLGEPILNITLMTTRANSEHADVNYSDKSLADHYFDGRLLPGIAASHDAHIEIIRARRRELKGRVWLLVAPRLLQDSSRVAVYDPAGR